MKRRQFCQGLATMGLLSATHWTSPRSVAQPTQVAPQKSLHVGSDKQLFIDQKFIAAAENVRIVMNPPIKAGQVLFADRPWEDFRLTSYFTVLQDGDLCRMYYSCFSKDQWHTPDAWDKHAYLCYAESRDGVHWEKPRLGIVEFEGSKHTNILLRSVVDGAVFLDPLAPPARRYKLLHTVGLHQGGLRVSYSPDGIHFTTPQTPVSPWNPDSQQVAFWDSRLRKYVAFLRKSDRGRAVGRVEMENLDTPWPGDLPTVFKADEHDPPDVDFYTSACVQYPWAANAYFMFPAAYHHFPPELGNDGLLDTSAAASRDGIHWERPDRRPYVALGEASEWDAKFVMMGVGMVRKGNAIHQYYNGVNLSHGGTRRMTPEQRATWRRWSQIGRVVQRLDGFYSADAAYDGGWLITPPLVFTGSRLELNIHTSSAGQAHVAIVDADGQPLPGYAVAECDRLMTNSVAHRVSWRGKPDVSALAGKPVRLKFIMRSAKLYAFQFSAQTK
jgi:hypothetical protein